jgi:hypothetical protein
MAGKVTQRKTYLGFNMIGIPSREKGRARNQNLPVIVKNKQGEAISRIKNINQKDAKVTRWQANFGDGPHILRFN